MLGPVMVAATVSLCGLPADSFAAMYSPNRDPRPIASAPAPHINGRLFIASAHIGPFDGHAMPYFASPGPEYYGALDAVDAVVPVRVGHLVVSISPWERIDEPGLRHFEEARQFWLREHNFTGGVRTFVNDLHFWEPGTTHARADDQGVQEFRSDAPGTPRPRATIQLDPDAPRHRRPLRVQGDEPARPAAETVRVSWPHAAPARVVDRTSGIHTVTAAR